MSRNNFWKWIFIVAILAWSLYEIGFLDPNGSPGGRDLVQHFKERATRPDEAFSNIVVQAEAMQSTNSGRAYGNLQDAIGTNDITKYFPFFPAKSQLEPTTYILNRLQQEAAGKIKLGLDLQGGTAIRVEMDTNQLFSVQTITNASGQVESITNRSEIEGALNQAVEVLRKRVDRLGVAEPVIQPVGDNQILVQLPGLSEADRESAIKQVQRAAFLEFRLVHQDSDSLIAQGVVPPGYELLRREARGKDGKKHIEQAIVKKKAERGLTGNIVRSAIATRGQFGEPQIEFTLTDEGAVLFGQVTKENQGRQLAIVLDGELYSAPRIDEPILTGRGQITSPGGFDPQEARELANILENPLRAPLKVVYTKHVDPTLGKESIESGIRASIVGVILVTGFMLVYYLMAGAVANAALLLNVTILMGVMCSIDATLTLPGIAGIVLTIGMAVDANVLIFERIREELAAGKSMKGALAAGYDKAFGTILDSNLTTLISSIILIFMGTGPIKGFGVTLTIGVLISMFTALVVTRLLFDWMLAKNILKSIKMLSIIKGSNIDFLRWAKPAFALSWLLIIVGLGYGIFVRGHDVLGVDFAGGIEQTYRYTPTAGGDEAVREDVEKVMRDLQLGEVTASVQKDFATGSKTLRIVLPYEEGIENKVTATLQEKLPQYEFRDPSNESVGPTIGREITRTALLSCITAMFFILLYVAFRYEFSFAVGAVVALVHDVLMTMGWYFLVGREVNATTVAAILTIIGFSINDTIVIFDRIREDLKLGVRGTFREIVNKAINQTLSRTIITSGTVLLATLSLYVFGGGPVNDFAFTFLVGILVGTYSTIYIASALVLWWHKGQKPQIGSQVSVGTTSETASA